MENYISYRVVSFSDFIFCILDFIIHIVHSFRYDVYITAPIVGTTAVQHIEEAVSALDIQLDEEEIKALEAPYVPHIKTGAF